MLRLRYARGWLPRESLFELGVCARRGCWLLISVLNVGLADFQIDPGTGSSSLSVGKMLIV